MEIYFFGMKTEEKAARLLKPCDIVISEEDEYPVLAMLCFSPQITMGCCDGFINLETGCVIDKEIKSTYNIVTNIHLFIDRLFKNNKNVPIHEIKVGQLFVLNEEYFLKINTPTYNALNLNGGFTYTITEYSGNCYVPEESLSAKFED